MKHSWAGSLPPCPFILRKSGKRLLMLLSILGPIMWTPAVAQQNFSRSLKSDSSYTDLVPTSYIRCSDGGYLLGGNAESSSGQKDIFLTEFDSEHHIDRSISFGGSADEELYDMCQLESGAYLLVGVTSSFGGAADDPFVVKISQTGSIEWARYYEGDYSVHRGVRIQETKDGNVLIAGTIVGYVGVGIGWGDMYLLETAPDGTVQNATILGNSEDDDIIDLIEEPDGDIVITGYSNSYQPDGFRNILLLKLNEDLSQIVWKHSYQEASSSLAQALTKTSDGGYAITGGDRVTSSDSTDMLLLKTDHSGNLEWSKHYDGGHYDQGTNVLDINSSTLGLLGNTKSLGQSSDLDVIVHLIDKNDQGAIERSVLLGGSKNDGIKLNGISSLMNADQKLLIAGWSFSFGQDSNESNIHLHKMDPLDQFCGAKPSPTNMNEYSVSLNDRQNFSIDLDSVSTSDSAIPLQADPFPLHSTTLCENLALRSKEKKSFKIFPNPASERISIHYPDGRPEAASLYDLSGERIEHFRSFDKGSCKLHVGDLPPGIYLLEMIDRTGSRLRKKLIIDPGQQGK